MRVFVSCADKNETTIRCPVCIRQYDELTIGSSHFGSSCMLHRGELWYVNVDVCYEFFGFTDHMIMNMLLVCFGVLYIDRILLLSRDSVSLRYLQSRTRSELEQRESTVRLPVQQERT